MVCCTWIVYGISLGQMIAKGRKVSVLFPSVVKNVVSKNAEVRTADHASFVAFTKIYYLLYQIKKLVYVYLVRYAEEEQDLALLSISTFQKALKVSGLFDRFMYRNIKRLVLLL